MMLSTLRDPVAAIRSLRRPPLRLSGILALLAWLASVAPATAGIQALEKAEAQRYAVIVEGPDEGGGRALASTLGTQFGFQVIHVPHADATLTNLQSIRDDLSGLVRPYDQLLVYIGLPFRRDPQLYYLPADGDPESPWSLLSARDLIAWVESLPTGAALFTYPACGYRPDGPAPEFETLAYSKRPGPVDILLACDLQAERESRNRNKSAESSSLIQWQAGELASGMARVLAEAADSGFGRLDSQQLVDRVSESTDSFDVRLLSLPRGQGPSLSFVPAASGDDYRRRYAQATSAEELSKILLEFVATGLDRESSQRDLIDFLVEIAGDARTAAGSAPLDTKELATIRVQAIEVLRRIGTYEARDALIEVYRRARDSAVARWQAITGLSRLPTPREQDLVALREALDDSDSQVRVAAVQGLAVARDDQAPELLEELVLDDRDLEVRRTALQTLADLGAPDELSLFIQVLFEDPEAGLRREAASALARLGESTESCRALANSLRTDADAQVRQNAAYGMGRTWTPEASSWALSTLVEALNDEAEIVAAAAAASLGRIPGPESETALVEVLRGDSPESVRIAAAESVGRLQSTAAVPELERVARSKSAGLRRAAVTALGAIGTDRAAAVLLQTLEDSDPYVRGEAQRAIERLDVEQRRVLLGVDSESPFVRSLSYKELGALGPSGTEPLIQGLGDDSRTARMEAVHSLAQRSDTDTIRQLASAFRNPNVLIRQGAATVLGKMEGGESDEILTALRAGWSDPSSAVRAETARALGQQKHPQSVDLLVRGLSDESADVRRASAEALYGRHDEPEVRRRLEALAKSDPSRDVRDAAISVLSGTDPARYPR